MSCEKEIQELKSISYKAYDEMDVERFAEIIEDLWDKADNSIIGDLCLIFDDEMEYPSILEEAIDMIFHISSKCGFEDGMLKLANGIPKMLIRGKGWAMMLHKMILDSYDDISPYVNAIKKVDNSTKEMIIDIFKKVKESQPDKYRERVDKILEEL